MSNPFDNIISKEFKKLYTDAIDGILSDSGLTVPCKFEYSGQDNVSFCENCIYDPISKLSTNIYNGTGPAPFTEGTMCPVCLGMGAVKTDSNEIINMAVIFDSKYFLNYSSNAVNISDGMAQTICDISKLPKIRNANSVVFDTDISASGNYVYYRAGEPTPVGLGQNKYVITMWKKQ